MTRHVMTPFQVEGGGVLFCCPECGRVILVSLGETPRLRVVTPGDQCADHSGATVDVGLRASVSEAGLAPAVVAEIDAILRRDQ